MKNLGVRRPVVGSIAWLGVRVAAGQWWNKKLPRTASLPDREGAMTLGEMGGVPARNAWNQIAEKSASTKAGAARRESKAEMPCYDR